MHLHEQIQICGHTHIANIYVCIKIRTCVHTTRTSYSLTNTLGGWRLRTCAHTHRHTHSFTYKHTLAFSHTHCLSHMQAYTQTRTHTHTHTHTHTYTHTHTHNQLDTKCRDMFLQQHEASVRMYRYLFQVNFDIHIYTRINTCHLACAGLCLRVHVPPPSPFECLHFVDVFVFA